MQCLLGIDVGSIGVKATIFELDGSGIVANSYVEYPTERPHPLWAEQDPETVWNATVSTVKTCVKVAGRKRFARDDILAVGVCGHIASPTPLDKRGRCLRKTIMFYDQRALPICSRIEDDKVLREELRRAGNVMTANTYAAPKILWIKENEPRIWEKTYKFLAPKDLINYRLTGEFATDWSEASVWMTFDMAEESWSEDVCANVGIPLEKLPDCHASTHVLGEVTSSTARMVGLKRGTPVVCGGGDFPCTAFGAGVIGPGRTCDNSGTVTNLIVALDKPRFDWRFINAHSVMPKQWYAAAGMLTTGAMIRWFRENLARGEEKKARRLRVSPYTLLDESAAKVPPGSEGHIVLPYFAGERSPIFDLKARGVFFGLNLATRKEHIFRAMLEATAYGMRHNLEVFEELNYEVGEIRAVSGGAKSRLWLQIKADVIGRELAVPDMLETGTLGVAVLAGTGVKALANFEAVNRMIRIVTRYSPRASLHEKYSRFYQLYRKMYERLKSDFVSIAEVAGDA